MTHNVGRSRGMLDKSSPPVKVPMLRTYTYREALSKAIEYVYEATCENNSRYYLADSSGAMICDT